MAAETKWTQGPWQAYELDPDDPAWEACEIWPSENDREQEDGQSEPVATMVCGVANAQLIAAAPDLYEALQRLDQFGHTDATWDYALRAMAKARGEA
ncbi:hypothetical protein HEP73_02124 [Xanthomonas sp. GW]|uniref:hypothetical protein n=1 Tax=Xanthomonas sp. GW TaxID=2724121 RepID=UPI00163A9BF5|nr:hypothetical protein [Xanthomonas sp. GW]QNH21212.1 hypothetical protein HEP73_02124 [Xanthomonas sp. GW]